MARGGSSSSKKGEENAESMERGRLKKLALNNSILSDAPAKFFTLLSPSNQVIKHHGKDILKKSQRKNRFLFSFPGLLAPISGGTIGELNNLGTKNPVLYIDFPQGRMKLFGTIVYPKNRYLTLQFSRGGKNVMCEDCFDNMVVFSDVWWIGKKDENPEEAQLDFPKELSEGQPTDYDFKGGAGVVSKGVPKIATRYTEQQSPEANKDDLDDEKNLNDKIQETPLRQSKRNAQKKFKK
ncbi:DNA-binding protein RHL1 isoform X3 [Carica papaya]|uniref:DNA-binding protein RHL1 isoform X3 n=1 Tax=Carica papaya TaxID=3649 RepID=UPI000B8C7EF4|nr:DNA-binding protein RHL1 isoform X3 [Carica papaya]